MNEAETERLKEEMQKEVEKVRQLAWGIEVAAEFGEEKIWRTVFPQSIWEQLLHMLSCRPTCNKKHELWKVSAF